MLWSGAEVQRFRAYALMLDELVGHPMTGSPHRGGDVYVHETRQRRLANRHARGEGRDRRVHTAVGSQQQPAGSTEVRGL